MIEGKPTFILTMRTTLLLALPLFVACDNDSSPAGSSGSGGDPPTWDDHSVHETDTGLDFPGGCTCGAPNLGDLVVGDRWTVEGHIGDFFSLDQYDGFKFIGSETQAFLIDFTLEPLSNIAESDIDLSVPGFLSTEGDEFPLDTPEEVGSFLVEAHTDEVGMLVSNRETNSEWRLVFTVSAADPLTEDPPLSAPTRVLWIDHEGRATCTLHFPPTE